jgi:membrane protease YdiL (CAAX protease family)
VSVYELRVKGLLYWPTKKSSKGGLQMMSRLSNVVQRHPLITFFALTYALSWAFEIPLVVLGDGIAGTQGLVLNLLAASVPSVLAIVFTTMVLGRGALRKLLGRLLIWRVDPRWYLVVLGPAVLAGGMIAFNVLLGGPAISLGVPLLTVLFFLAFSIFPGSALGEEIGWRGYALPRLQAGRSALSASLILGVIWGFYHLPLYFTGQASRPLSIFPLFVVSTIALSVIMTWMYNGTGGSLLLVVLIHATFNLPLTLLIAPLGRQETLAFSLYVGLLVVAAIVVVIVAGPKHLSRKHKKQEEGAAEPRVATPPGAVKPTPT